ncbi:MAG TPA: flavodoxin-dependent (E)-4-hydroxy-3-methylbut-2-enyl-diphosphate synthase, partial [Chthoniobacterales bacterium]
SLLADGIGDTIRVSLTEDSIHEIPVARALVDCALRIADFGKSLSEIRNPKSETPFDPFSYQRRATETIERSGVRLGGEELVRVVVSRANYEKIAHKIDRLGDYRPEIVYEDAELVEIDPRNDEAITSLNKNPGVELVTIRDGIDLSVITAYRLLVAKLDSRHPVLLKDVLCHSERNEAQRNRAGAVMQPERERPGFLSHDESLKEPQREPSTSLRSAQDDGGDFLDILLTAATNIGSLLCDGIGDAILVRGEEAPGQSLRLSYNILQAAGSRIFKTDYVACPSCGRTLFNLQTTTARIKAATLHLKGVKIAIMGCIVNGPGEMADADFGYVGGAPGKVNLYVGKTPVKFNIPELEAVDRLQDLIREHGKWVEPPAPVAAAAL